MSTPGDGPREDGVLDPRFVGVSLAFGSVDDLSEARRTFSDGTGAGPGGDDLRSIVRRSTPEHAVRHFHDFLVSPYSHRIFRLRLQALADGAQLFPLAREVPGTCLPTPLVTWLATAHDERERVLAGWRADLGVDPVPPPLPVRTRAQVVDSTLAARHGATPVGHLGADKQFALFAESTAMAYARLEQLVVGFGPFAATTSPTLVHEVSALSTQLAAIHRGQGVAQMLAFAGFLLDSDLPHARAWQRLLPVGSMLGGPQGTVESVGLPRVVVRMQQLALWCLLGSYDLEGPTSCPSVRLEHLVSEVVDDPSDPGWVDASDGDRDPSAAWDYWDERAGVTPWRHALTDLLDRADRGVEQYRLVAASFGGDAAVPDLVAEVLDDVRAQQRQVVGVLLADPAALADPFRYVRLDPDVLPAPAVRLEVAGDAVPAGDAGPGGRVLTRRDVHGEDVVRGVAFPLRPGPEADARLDRALRLERLGERCDLVFSDRGVPDHVAASAGPEVADLTGKSPLPIPAATATSGAGTGLG